MGHGLWAQRGCAPKIKEFTQAFNELEFYNKNKNFTWLSEKNLAFWLNDIEIWSENQFKDCARSLPNMFLLSRHWSEIIFCSITIHVHNIVGASNKSFNCIESKLTVWLNVHNSRVIEVRIVFVRRWHRERLDSPWCCVWHLEMSIAGRLVAVSLVWLLMLDAFLIFLFFGWTRINHFSLEDVRRGSDKILCRRFHSNLVLFIASLKFT